jgi:hypothetical protein
VVTGSRKALYNADALIVDRPAVLSLRVLESLAIRQEIGDTVAVVSTGPVDEYASLERLVLCSDVFITFQNDEPEEQGGWYWREEQEDGMRWRRSDSMPMRGSKTGSISGSG